MANRRIYLDKSELTLLIPGKKKVEDVHLTSGVITRIQFDKCTERMLFVIPQQSEKITITTSKRAQPVVYTKGKNKVFFDQYKQELEKFAKENNVTFADNTK
jgi:hypothetical protein